MVTIIIIALVLVLGAGLMLLRFKTKSATQLSIYGMSYTQSLGLAPINWRKELKRKHTRNLSNAAFEWSLCAVGSMPAVIPRDAIGKPLDKELKDLGARFAASISYGNVSHALDLLTRIEQRSLELCK